MQRRLYKESTKIHATHDAELLKKVGDGDNINTTNNLSENVMIRLQAGAFNSLCHHLRVRSDTVQNLELMTISGFCRNCLAKVCGDHVCRLGALSILFICRSNLILDYHSF